MRSLHADNGTEFKIAQKALKAEGVDIHLTTGYTAPSNGLAERTHGVVLSHARASLAQANLPAAYWDYAVENASKIKNLVPHSTTGVIPYFRAFGHHSSDLRHIRPFGCRMLYHPVSNKLPTFDVRLREGICLGHQGGGIYTVLTEHGTVRTKHVRAFEDKFPDIDGLRSSDGQSSAGEAVDATFEIEQDAESDDQGHDEDEQVEDEEGQEPSEDHLTYVPSHPSTFGEPEGSGSGSEESSVSAASEYNPEEADETDQESSENATEGGAEISSLPSRSTARNLRDQSRVDYSYSAVPTLISTDDEPKLKEALNSAEKSEWIAAITDEFANLFKNKTWDATAVPPPRTKVIPTGIVLKLKRDADGNPSRYKARLVARGNFQEDCFDFGELYAPVACIESVRVILAVASVRGWSVHHLDVKGAFLYAPLQDADEMWIRLPSIPEIAQASGTVVKLRKSLYGLRQAPKLWYKLLADTLKRIGFRISVATECLFIGGSPSKSVYLLVYVDDLMIVGGAAEVWDVKRKLSTVFSTTDLGECNHFLGIKIYRQSSGLFLTQRPYAQKIIELVGMKSAKSTEAPLPLSHPLYDKLTPSDQVVSAAMVAVPYRQILGTLLFLSTRTRPDLATAVSMLGKYQSDPAPQHWKAMKNVIRYLISTMDWGIQLPSTAGGPTLTAWSDADWARDCEKRRSRTGYLLCIGGGPVVWASRLQSCTAQSTSEAEFNALSACVRDVCWVREVLSDMGSPQIGPTVIYQDNLGAISWTTDVQGLRRVKHVGIKYHYVRGEVESNNVRVEYCESEKNKADSMTKALIGSTFKRHRTYLGCIALA